MTNVTRFRVDLQALKYQFLALERINVFGGDKPKITELCLSGGGAIGFNAAFASN